MLTHFLFTDSVSSIATTSATLTSATNTVPTPSFLQAPTTTSVPPSTSSTSTTSSTPVTTSSAISTTSATPTSTSTPVSTSSSTPVTSNTQSTSTPATTTTAGVVTTTTPSTSTSTTSTPTPIPTPTTTSRASTSTVSRNISSRSTVIVTTSDGQLVTATIIVSPSETAAAASTKKSFFQNTGAVVGVFVVVGIVAMILLVVIGTVFLRRRRAKQFDLDVQEAAREAARAQAPVDDDDYAGTSYNTHSSKPITTEQRAYGYGATGVTGWDPYARGAAPGGYEMQHRRTSTGTAPGMAGFGAGDVFARTGGVDQQQGYGQQQGYNQGYAYGQGNQGHGQQGYAQDGYNTGYGQGYGQQPYNSSYSNASLGNNNASAQQGYALAQEQPVQGGRAPVHAQMMMPDPQRHSYNNVGAFRQSPSYGQAHPGEQVQYEHAEPADTLGQDGRYPAAPRMSEDPYGGYLPHDEPGPSTTSQVHSTNPPAYVPGPSNVGATGERKVGRKPSRKSQETSYSRDDESDEEPTRRVLKVANE
ncbi:hypothetical protein RSAG8_09411, partial [Rhizoctonia solani AG-8 WAC10335]